MDYFFKKAIDMPVEEAVQKVTSALAEEGFGILTEIDVQATLKKKIDVDMPYYRILGACNPPFAHKALQSEERIGLMLPCNVIVREVDGRTEVAAIDPVASMLAVDNPDLSGIAVEVRDKLRKVIEEL